MALKDTYKTLRTLLEEILGDLEKAEAGNKAAAQRVRTATIRLEKAAKTYRKESIKADKNGFMKKAKAAAKKKSTTSAAPQKAQAKKEETKKVSSMQNAAASSAKETTPTADKTSPSKAPSTPKKRATAKLPKRTKK